MKTCTKCRQNLPDTSFNRHSRNKTGLRSECRECQREKYQEYRGPITRNFGGGRYLKTTVNGKTVSLHRHIMETILGRPLTKDEVVHHINGNKKDNRPENLQVMSVSEHSILENRGRKLTKEHKAKVSLSLMGNQRRKGIPHSSEIKARISESLRATFAKKKRRVQDS